MLLCYIMKVFGIAVVFLPVGALPVSNISYLISDISYF